MTGEELYEIYDRKMIVNWVYPLSWNALPEPEKLAWDEMADELEANFNGRRGFGGGMGDDQQ